MEVFQKTVLFIVIIILIITLIIISVALINSKNNKTWPPLIPQCPDYWIIDGSGNNALCINQKNLGTCKPIGNEKHLVMDFNTPTFTGSNGNCAKYTWAKNCNVSWDGITYGVNNPCQTISPT